METLTLTENQIIESKYTGLEMEVMSRVMEEEGIYPGDRLIIDERIQPSDGQIIVARLNGELLLRKLQTDGIQIRLLAGGSKLAPLEVDTRFCRFEVVGVVSYVIKKL